MNEQQLSMAIVAGKRMFAQGSNLTGIDGSDIDGVFFLKQMILQLSSGDLRLIRASEIVETPEPSNVEPE